MEFFWRDERRWIQFFLTARCDSQEAQQNVVDYAVCLLASERLRLAAFICEQPLQYYWLCTTSTQRCHNRNLLKKCMGNKIIFAAETMQKNWRKKCVPENHRWRANISSVLNCNRNLNVHYSPTCMFKSRLRQAKCVLNAWESSLCGTDEGVYSPHAWKEVCISGVGVLSHVFCMVATSSWSAASRLLRCSSRWWADKAWAVPCSCCWLVSGDMSTPRARPLNVAMNCWLVLAKPPQAKGSNWAGTNRTSLRHASVTNFLYAGVMSGAQCSGRSSSLRGSVSLVDWRKTFCSIYHMFSGDTWPCGLER